MLYILGVGSVSTMEKHFMKNYTRTETKATNWNFWVLLAHTAELQSTQLSSTYTQ